MDSCIFCQIINRDAPARILFEDERVCCFLDKYPITKGHVLVVPKTHSPEFKDVEEASLNEVILAAQKVAVVLEEILHPDGTTIMQDGGAFKDVDHYHMHVIPRFKGDGFSVTEPETAIEEAENERLYAELCAALDR